MEKYSYRFIVDEDYSSGDSLGIMLKYLADTGKTKGFIGARNVSSDVYRCEKQMQLVKRFYNKSHGTQFTHLVISAPIFNEVPMRELWKIGYCLASFLGTRFQVFFAVHDADPNTEYSEPDCKHFHFIFNSISFDDGRKYEVEKTLENKQFRGLLEDYLKYTEELLEEEKKKEQQDE